MKLRLEVELKHKTGPQEDADYMADIVQHQRLLGHSVAGNSSGEGPDSVYEISDVVMGSHEDDL